MPFLRATNPVIDWVHRTLTFPSTSQSVRDDNAYAELTIDTDAQAQLGTDAVQLTDVNLCSKYDVPCIPSTPLLAPTHGRKSTKRSTRSVHFDPVVVACDEAKLVGGFERCFDQACLVEKSGWSLQRAFCGQCKLPLLDTVESVNSCTRQCMHCGYSFNSTPGSLCNPLADILSARTRANLSDSADTQTQQFASQDDVNCQPHESSKPSDGPSVDFATLVQERVQDFEEISFKQWLVGLKHNQYSEAFFCWSQQIIDAADVSNNGSASQSQYFSDPDYFDQACSYTHRTAHGQHGLGDKTTLTSLAESTLSELKHEFPSVFVEPTYPVARPDSQQHHIHLKDTQSDPPRKKLYALDRVKMQALKEQLQVLLDSGCIVHSSSPYGAPILFARKKDSDKLRMCIDYRALNANTVLDRYPLPRIDNLLSQLHGARVFSKLDLRDGYHQIPMHERDQYKTAFCTRYGQFEFTVMPFGLCNAPATFQRLMNQAFFTLLDKCVLVYLDDILIYSKNVTEHKQHLREVFKCLQRCNLCLKESKCSLFLESVEFLGHTISADGVTVEQGKVTAVTEWPTPKNVNEVQQFLGLCNYYRRFIRGFATVASPLTNLTRKKVQFVWDSLCEYAFVRLKTLLTSAPVLCVFDSSRPTRVCVDASTTCVGAVLEQQCEDQQWHPCEFFSKRLNTAQCNYSATERELLGVILAFERWRCYLIGTPFVCLTDHASNTYLLQQSKLSRRQATWLDFLAQFTFTFQHVPGRQNVVADTFSRLPLSGSESADSLHSVSDSPQSLASVISLTDESHLLDVVRRAQSAAHDDLWFQQCLQKVSDVSVQFSIRNEVLCKLVQDYYAPVIPPTSHDLKRAILSEIHCAALGGHLSYDKMLPELRARFFWPHMAKDCKRFCKECSICQQQRTSTQSPPGLLQPHSVPSKPFQHFSMDFITHLPLTERGYDAILTCVDRFSKMCVLIPCATTIDAATTARIFFENVVCKFGMPEKIISDRDTRFDSMFWRSLCRLLQCRINMSTAYHPQTDGQSERFNRSVEQVLRCFCSPRQDDWDLTLQQVAYALNSTVHKGTHVSAFECIYGFRPRLPLDHALHELYDNKVQAVDDLVQQRNAVQSSVAASLQHYNATMSRSADKHRRNLDLQPGDLVYISTANLRLHSAINRKLAPRWIGPYRVSAKISPVAFKIDLPATYRALHNVFHVSVLKLHHGLVSPPRDPVPLADSEPEYEVERILAKRLRNNDIEYLVHWRGYSTTDSTWEPAHHLRNAPRAIATFEKTGIRTRRQREQTT